MSVGGRGILLQGPRVGVVKGYKLVPAFFLNRWDEGLFSRPDGSIWYRSCCPSRSSSRIRAGGARGRHTQ